MNHSTDGANHPFQRNKLTGSPLRRQSPACGTSVLSDGLGHSDRLIGRTLQIPQPTDETDIGGDQASEPCDRAEAEETKCQGDPEQD
jgi:hypothetical protein